MVRREAQEAKADTKKKDQDVEPPLPRPFHAPSTRPRLPQFQLLLGSHNTSRTSGELGDNLL